jgi:hypothetical protein
VIHSSRFATAAAGLLVCWNTLRAAEAPADEEADLAKKLNNPVASLISVPFQSNEDFHIGPTGNGYKYWNTSQWTVPLNLSVTQVFKIGKQPMSLQLGGRYYADGPSGAPDWGVRLTFTLLFPTGKPEPEKTYVN